MGLFPRIKNNNKPLISQVIELIPPHLFPSKIRKFKTNKGCLKYKIYDQFVALMFGQLSRFSALEDVSVG